MKENKDKFNPVKCGFLKRRDKDEEWQYILLGDDEDRSDYNKVIGRMWHVNYFMGLPIEWEVFRVVHCVDGSTKEHSVFQGRIPENSFGRELIKNLFY